MMRRRSEDRPVRKEQYGWATTVAGDNGFDLLSYVIKVHDLADAAQKANDIAELMKHYEYENSEYDQISLRSWQIEILTSAPTGVWWSKSQQNLAVAINYQFGVSRT